MKRTFLDGLVELNEERFFNAEDPANPHVRRTWSTAPVADDYKVTVDGNLATGVALDAMAAQYGMNRVVHDSFPGVTGEYAEADDSFRRRLIARIDGSDKFAVVGNFAAYPTVVMPPDEPMHGTGTIPRANLKGWLFDQDLS